MRRPPHPGAGPQAPASEAPVRRPGSVRRTSSMDVIGRPALSEPLTLHGRARDLRTGPDGTASEVGAAELDVVIGRSGVRGTIEQISGSPDLPGTGTLTGASVPPGFRGALAAALPEEVAAASPLHALLDDVPGTVIVSGYAWADGSSGDRVDWSSGPRMPIFVDGCSGWAAEGTMMTGVRRDGALPPMAGPAAPDLGAADPLAWHLQREQMPGEVRRRRRTDVLVDPADHGVLVVDAMFRDSYCDLDGDESVVHEYGLSARVSRDGLTVLELSAEPRVLPWRECPMAAASAQRLVGRPVDSLRAAVRSEFTGTSTCTHLNDLLRSLADLTALAPALGA